MLLIVVAGCDVPRLTNQEKVCCQLTPVVALLSVIQPPPVEMDKVVLNTSSDSVCECVLIVDVLVCASNVGFKFIDKL